MRRTKRMETLNYQPGHLGKRLAKVRRDYEWSQAEAATHFPGNRSQQYVSDLEQKAVIEEPELQEAATAYQVTPAYIRNIKESALESMVINMYDNKQAFGPYNTNHFNPLEELLKAHEENKQLFREKEALIQRIIDKLEAENGGLKEIIIELKSELEGLKAQIVAQEKQIKALQDLLGNNDTK
ncbi:hypothetical protein SAMN05216436_101347 [bacterium A37T11]|nr:hypothetical protein SAMN05216436_101347 [bacterium A37T11]